VNDQKLKPWDLDPCSQELLHISRNLSMTLEGISGHLRRGETIEHCWTLIYTEIQKYLKAGQEILLRDDHANNETGDLES